MIEIAIGLLLSVAGSASPDAMPVKAPHATETRTMEQRLTFITLAVEDVAVARRFYEALGFVASESASQGDFVIFDLGGLGLSLYPRAGMAEEVAGGPMPGPAALAHNVADRAAVERIYEAALEAGARPVRPPADQFWGGYSAMFADPDGHYWEIGWNPHLALGPDGRLLPLD